METFFLDWDAQPISPVYKVPFYPNLYPKFKFLLLT